MLYVTVVYPCSLLPCLLSVVPMFGLSSAPFISISLYDFIHVKNKSRQKYRIYRKGILGSQIT